MSKLGNDGLTNSSRAKNLLTVDNKIANLDNIVPEVPPTQKLGEPSFDVETNSARAQNLPGTEEKIRTPIQSKKLTPDPTPGNPNNAPGTTGNNTQNQTILLIGAAVLALFAVFTSQK